MVYETKDNKELKEYMERAKEYMKRVEAFEVSLENGDFKGALKESEEIYRMLNDVYGIGIYDRFSDDPEQDKAIRMGYLTTLQLMNQRFVRIVGEHLKKLEEEVNKK
ncbi:MAG: hypothetical protein J7K22_03400 [Nanoarchaeota archaeon]|nr:hypothetical protein [Nanoarchaeota archaeon]